MGAKAEQSEVVKRALAMLQSPSPALRQEAPSWPCSACGKLAVIEEVDNEGRTFWTCPHCPATGVTPWEPGKPYNPQDKPSVLKELYREATAEIGDDYLPCISWLVEHYPQKWEAIKQADDHLTELERQRAGEQEYRQALDRLLTLLQEARGLKDGSRKARGRYLAPHHCGGVRFWLSVYSGLWICEKCTPPPQESVVKRRVKAGEEITEGLCFAQ